MSVSVRPEEAGIQASVTSLEHIFVSLGMAHYVVEARCVEASSTKFRVAMHG